MTISNYFSKDKLYIFLLFDRKVVSRKKKMKNVFVTERVRDYSVII